MSPKVIRDPLYNYIAIDRKRDSWLVDLLNCPEVQRLRRIHQRGVSDFTYPGASHTRFPHTLGVLHLMQSAYAHFERNYKNQSLELGRPRLLAAAVLHDVGHGPFSHLFEPCLGIDHESWSIKIVRNKEGSANTALRKVDSKLPESVAQIIDKEDVEIQHWQKLLLSSQLDVDRMDYLRRDSLFTGAGYGHFDWYRLINTPEFVEDQEGNWDIVWPEKAKYAIEEYIFARYYMYQNVYLHKTTRGFECMLQAMWERARFLQDEGIDVDLMPAIADYWKAEVPSVEQYLAIEEYTVLEQLQRWQSHKDKALSDLARRFMNRERLVMIEPPEPDEASLEDCDDDWNNALKETVQKAGFDPGFYCLRDELKAKYYQPYFPEKESDEQSAKNAIRIKVDGEEKPMEISRLLDRLRPITKEKRNHYRYYVPSDVRKEAKKLREEWPKK